MAAGLHGVFRWIRESRIMSVERAKAADAFAMAYARKMGMRIRVRPEIWTELREAGADMALYLCDTR